MDAATMKRYALGLVIAVAVACVLVWKTAPLLKTTVPPGPRPPPGSVLVDVNMIGFDPASIPAKVGQPIKLAFYRPNAANCVREVVFPSLGIRKELPPGQTVVVDITPQKSGPLGFECGMKMRKGQLIVR